MKLPSSLIATRRVLAPLLSTWLCPLPCQLWHSQDLPVHQFTSLKGRKIPPLPHLLGFSTVNQLNQLAEKSNEQLNQQT